MVVATIVYVLTVVDKLYLTYTPFPYNCYNKKSFIYEDYLIPIKCYTGETVGDQIIVTIFELYMSV